MDTRPAVFIIRLESCRENPKAYQQLKEAGYTVHCVSAVDGRHLLHQTTRAALYAEFAGLEDLGWQSRLEKINDEAQRQAKAASIGCLLSHIRCLKSIQRMDLPCALVLEDDAVLGPSFAKVLPALSAQSARFDILRLHYSNRPMATGLKLWDAVVEGEQKDKQAQEYVVYQFLWGHTGAVACLYSQSGAEKLLQLHATFNADYRYNFDQLHGLWYRHGLRYCFIRPQLAWQDPSLQSTIYAKFSNAAYLKNIANWFTWRGRLERCSRRVWRRYILGPHLLILDIWRVFYAFFVGLKIYLAHQRYTCAAGISDKYPNT